MKFEFDHKTGMMRPKKDEEIYFAKSQGGGLIVDDKKHNIKFIIERDERITKLFGNFDKDRLNFYDMRDARMIADRVVRLFGSDHKYTDFHYFLKGYVMKENVIKNCSDFLDESTWGRMLDRGEGEVKKEDGRLIGKLDDGTRLILSNTAFADGDLVDFDGENVYNIWGNIHIAIITDGDVDCYYAFDKDIDLEDGDGNMTKCFETDSSLRTDHDLKPLIAIIRAMDDWDDDCFFNMDIRVYEKSIDFGIGRWLTYVLYFDKDDAVEDAVEDAIEIEKESLKGLINELSQKYLTSTELKDIRKRFHKFIDNIRNNDGFDEDTLKDVFEESFELDYDDLDEEDAIEELLRYEIIKDSEEYFGLDDDGEIDHTQPKFDYQDYRDEYVEKRMDEIDDFVEEYIANFGSDEVKNQINIHKLAELIINADGPETELASYDNVEREEEVDGDTYYIYRKE